MLQKGQTLSAHTPKIALVYDRVNTRFGGAEYVLQVLHQMYPAAPLYTSVYDPKHAHWAQKIDVRPSFVQRIPFAKNNHRHLVQMMPIAFESFDFSEFDIVITVTSAEAKGIITSLKTLHICYLLTPTRYLWSHHHEYTKGIFSRFKSFIFSQLRIWDYLAAQRPDIIIPISKLVADRCQKYYRRKPQKIIYPPMKDQFVENTEISETNSQPLVRTWIQDELPFYIMVTRLVQYKKVDIAIRACAQAKQPLHIIGDGPDKNELQKLINDNGASAWIKIFSQQSQHNLHKQYGRAKALILLAEEDFGLVALEAQSYGLPVIVNKHSGASEVVVNGKTGMHISDSTVDDLLRAMYSIDTKVWESEYIQRNAQQYNTDRFTQQFSEAVTKAWNEHLLR